MSNSGHDADKQDMRTNEGEDKPDHDVSVGMAISEVIQASPTLGPAEPACFV